MLIIKVLYKNVWKELDLGELSSISFNFESSIWDFENIPGSYSFPFELPATKNNNLYFDFPNANSNSNQTFRKIDAQIWINGILFKECTIKITETDDDQYKCTFLVDNASFFDKTRDKDLSSIDLGGWRNWVWKYEYSKEQGDDFALFPIANISFFRYMDLDETNQLYIDSAEEDPQYGQLEYLPLFVQNYFNISIRFDITQIMIGGNQLPYPAAIIPFPYLFVVMNNLSDEYRVTENCIEDDTVLQNLVMINNVNAFQVNRTGFDYYHYLVKYNLANHLPQISIHKLLKLLKGLSVAPVVIGKSIKFIFIKDILTSPKYIDITEKTVLTSGKIFEDEKLVEFNWEFNNDLIYNRRIETKDFLTGNNVTRSYTPPADPELGDMWARWQSFSESIGLEFWTYVQQAAAYEFTNHYGSFQNYFDARNPGKTINLHQSSPSPFTANFGTLEPENEYLIKRYAHIGNSHENKDENKIVPILVFYKGFIEGLLHDIPHGGKTDDVNEFTLDLNSNYGIIETYWKEYIAWQKNLTYTSERQLIFDITELMNFDFSKKYLIYNKLYFINSMQFTVKATGKISPVTCTLIPAP